MVTRPVMQRHQCVQATRIHEFHLREVKHYHDARGLLRDHCVPRAAPTSAPRTNRPLQCTTATSLFFSTSIVSMTDSLMFFSQVDDTIAENVTTPLARSFVEFQASVVYT